MGGVSGGVGGSGVSTETVAAIESVRAPGPVAVSQLQETGRFFELDALRGVAALLVVLYHFTEQVARQASEGLRVPWGGLGVQLFFVISGFVILLTLERSKSVSDFSVSRFARLFPAYWLACTVMISVYGIVGWPGVRPTLAEQAFNYTMFQSFLGVPSVSGVFWTLHVELAFYVFMASLFVLGIHKYAVGVSTALVAGWLMVTLALGINEFAFARSPEWLLRARMLFPLLFHHLHPLPFFLLGMVLFSVRSGWGVQNSVGAAIAAMDIGLHTFRHRDHLEWMVLAGLLGLAVVATLRGLAFLRMRPLVFLGTISYSLYLLHIAVGVLTIDWLLREIESPNAVVLFATTASVVVAAVGTYILEQPANAAIRWWWKASRGRDIVATGLVTS